MKENQLNQTPSLPLRVGLVEDQHMFREALKLVIDMNEDMEVVFESSDGFSVVEKLQNCEELPDVMLVDLLLPPDGQRIYKGLDLTRELKTTFPQIDVLIVSSISDPFSISQLIEHGAQGYVTKDSTPDELQQAIRSVRDHGTYVNRDTLKAITDRMVGQVKKQTVPDELSNREIQILKLICEDKSAREIGQELFISETTVNGHRNKLLQKTGARSIIGLVVYAIRNRIFQAI